MLVKCPHCSHALSVEDDSWSESARCSACSQPLQVPAASGDQGGLATLSPEVASLVSRWEQMRLQGQSLSAAELCRECPELLPEVRRQLEALANMAAFVGDTGSVPATVAPG